MENDIPFELFKKLDKAGFTCKKTYSLPTLDDVLKWLRDEKKLYILPSDILIKDNIKWDVQIDDLNTSNIIYESRLIYSSYEEAAIAGIEYVLDKELINYNIK